MKQTGRTTIVVALTLSACAQGPDGDTITRQSALTGIYRVGRGETYASFAALPPLKPGDLVEVMGDATYGAVTLRAAGSSAAKITFRGLRVNGRRPVISGGTNTVAFEASHHLVFEGFDVTGGSSRCMFNHAHDVTVRDTVVHHCPAHGILGADEGSGSLTLDHVEVHHCGAGDQKHPIYIATDEVAYPGSVFRLQHSYLHDNNGGHGVKSRAERNEIYYNWIEGSYYHELELIGPDGTPESLKREDSDVVGNVIRKTGPNARFHAVRIGGDGTGMTHGRYRFVNNTFVLAPGVGSAIRAFDAVESIEAHNNVFFRDSGGAIDVVRTVEASPVPAVTGSHNWVMAGSPIPAGFTGTLVGVSPGFTALGDLDLRPAPGSPVINQGQAPPPPFTAHPFVNPLGAPVEEPARNATSAAVRRAGTDSIDPGAFEAGMATAIAPPPPTAPACHSATANGTTVVSDVGMPRRTGRFTATIEVTPTMANMDGAVMLGQNAMNDWSDGAAIVLFSDAGTIKVRRGDVYAADVAMSYKTGTAYRVRFDVDLGAHTYSVYVTPAGGSEVRVAGGYALRTAWSAVTSLGHWAAIAGSGGVRACDFVSI